MRFSSKAGKKLPETATLKKRFVQSKNCKKKFEWMEMSSAFLIRSNDLCWWKSFANICDELFDLMQPKKIHCLDVLQGIPRLNSDDWDGLTDLHETSSSSLWSIFFLYFLNIFPPFVNDDQLYLKQLKAFWYLTRLRMWGNPWVNL